MTTEPIRTEPIINHTQSSGMLERIIQSAIAHRWVVLLLTVILCGFGLYSASHLPIDAVPDITNVQVQVNTEAAGLTPLEVEQRITYPLETALAGLPTLERRSTRFTARRASRNGADRNWFRRNIFLCGGARKRRAG